MTVGTGTMQTPAVLFTMVALCSCCTEQPNNIAWVCGKVCRLWQRLISPSMSAWPPSNPKPCRGCWCWSDCKTLATWCALSSCQRLCMRCMKHHVPPNHASDQSRMAAASASVSTFLDGADGLSLAIPRVAVDMCAAAAFCGSMGSFVW